MDSGRRQLLLQALGAVGAIAFPNGTSAQRRRVLGEASDIHQSPPGGKPDGDLSSWLLSMRVGPAAAHASLLAFWLAAKDEPSKFDITTLDEARRSGTLLITERAQATVPELIVDNRGKVPVFLLAGEILVGGKQNRILIEDVLLPPLSGVRPLGVYCVEQGRWNDGSREFSSKGSFAQPRLRSKLLEGAGQRQVWDSVAQASREYLASPAPTQSYQAIYDDQRIRAHADEVERTAQLRLPPASTAPPSSWADASPASTSSIRPASSRASGQSSCARTRSRPFASTLPRSPRARAATRCTSSSPRPREPRAFTTGMPARVSSSSSRYGGRAAPRCSSRAA